MFFHWSKARQNKPLRSDVEEIASFRATLGEGEGGGFKMRLNFCFLAGLMKGGGHLVRRVLFKRKRPSQR